MDLESAAAALTALIAAIALGLSVYNTVRARTPRPHWDATWLVGADAKTVLKDGIRLRIINRGRGDAHDVSIEARTPGDEWDEVARVTKVAFGESLTASVDYSGNRSLVMIIWDGTITEPLPPGATPVPEIEMRVWWRQAPSTHKLRSKRFRTDVPRGND